MTSREHEERLDELGNDPGGVASESGGQSGDSQGLPQVADETGESVEALAESGQTYESEILEGVEDAADHPERPVHTREDKNRSPEIAPIRRSD